MGPLLLGSLSCEPFISLFFFPCLPPHHELEFPVLTSPTAIPIHIYKDPHGASLPCTFHVTLLMSFWFMTCGTHINIPRPRHTCSHKSLSPNSTTPPRSLLSLSAGPRNIPFSPLQTPRHNLSHLAHPAKKISSALKDSRLLIACSYAGIILQLTVGVR